MKKLEENESDATPLQKKLEAIANDIGILGTIAAALTVAVLFIRFFMEQGSLGYDWENDFGAYMHQWF